MFVRVTTIYLNLIGRSAFLRSTVRAEAAWWRWWYRVGAREFDS